MQIQRPEPLFLAAVLGPLLAGCRGTDPVPTTSAVSTDGATVELSRALAAMGTDLGLRVWGETRADAITASEQAVRAIERVEARLSTWTEESELAALNRAAVGEEVSLSPELARDLARARALWHETSGAFDPSVGALVRAVGLRSGGRAPEPAELERARATVGFDGLELDGQRAIKTRPGLLLEEGGFGKGVGLDAALVALGEHAAVLDLGGQVALQGARFQDQPLVIALADPRDRARPVLELELDRGSLATSGNSERGVVIAGEPHSHLIDPRTGTLAPDFGSVSVWARNATDADALSTALYVLGPEGALAWARQSDRLLGAIVLERPSAPNGPLRARLTSAFRGRVRALVPDLELRIDPPGPTRQPDLLR